MKVTIYGKPQCPLCDRSKALVEARGIDFEYIDFVAANMTREELSVIVGRPVHSVPQILIDGSYIGSYPQLVDRLRVIKEETKLNDFVPLKDGEALAGLACS